MLSCHAGIGMSMHENVGLSVIRHKIFSHLLSANRPTDKSRNVLGIHVAQLVIDELLPVM